MNRILSYVNTKNFIQNDIDIFFSKDRALLMQYYEVREHCYRKVPNGPVNFNGQENEHDLHSDLLIIKYKNTVVGGARIVGNINETDRLLPLESNDFQIKNSIPHLELQNKVYCEFGRLALINSFRCTYMLDKIVECLVTYSMAKGYMYLFAMCPLVQARCYRQSLQRLGIRKPFTIHRDVKIPNKKIDECGSLNMYLTSLEFPHTWNGIKSNRLYHDEAR